MRMIFGLVLVVGLALAGGAVYMAKNYVGAYQSALAEERANSEKAVPTIEVWVADKALSYGQTLSDEDVRTVLWPVNAIPEGAFTEENPLFEEDQEPRVVIRSMDKDEAIMATKVSEPGADAGIASRLEPGQRAFAIKVDVASGVSGFLRPNDRVDVYWTGRSPGDDPNLPRGDVTKLIETGVRLIAIDQNSLGGAPEATIARTVTVAASPQQVAALAQAQSTGRLSLSLMGANDDTVAEAIEVDQRSLLGISRPGEKVETKKREVCTIRTRRGAEVVEIPIPCSN